MTWLIFAVAVIAYIVIGQFVAGMLDPDGIGEVVALTIAWPLIALVVIVYIPGAKLRKLGRRLGEWLENRDFIN